MRTAKINRKTQETEIAVEINLDGSGDHNINTGIGFFDHMLTQVAVHGLIDISIQAKGDLHVDPHHTVEDCGLTLGTAFAEALGNKAGVTRTASAVVPMDEALGQVVIDFSGRPFSVVNVGWTAAMVGGLHTTLIEHFFQSFAVTSASTIHLLGHYGKDNHHIAESLFKAFGRAIKAAAQIDPRRGESVPSSKGVL